ncbi:hypothetical protein [Symmachiella dynata]|nr:hypothetical protein [Symmachiella dynata]
MNTPGNAGGIGHHEHDGAAADAQTVLSSQRRDGIKTKVDPETPRQGKL